MLLGIENANRGRIDQIQETSATPSGGGATGGGTSTSPIPGG